MKILKKGTKVYWSYDGSTAIILRDYVRDGERFVWVKDEDGDEWGCNRDMVYTRYDNLIRGFRRAQAKMNKE